MDTKHDQQTKSTNDQLSTCKTTLTNDQLSTCKTVIVGLDEADYSRLQLICERKGISMASYIEDATIMRINDESWEKADGR